MAEWNESPINKTQHKLSKCQQQFSSIFRAQFTHSAESCTALDSCSCSVFLCSMFTLAGSRHSFRAIRDVLQSLYIAEHDFCFFRCWIYSPNVGERRPLCTLREVVRHRQMNIGVKLIVFLWRQIMDPPNEIFRNRVRFGGSMGQLHTIFEWWKIALPPSDKSTNQQCCTRIVRAVCGRPQINTLLFRYHFCRLGQDELGPRRLSIRAYTPFCSDRRLLLGDAREGEWVGRDSNNNNIICNATTHCSSHLHWGFQSIINIIIVSRTNHALGFGAFTLILIISHEKFPLDVNICTTLRIMSVARSYKHSMALVVCPTAIAIVGSGGWVCEKYTS